MTISEERLRELELFRSPRYEEMRELVRGYREAQRIREAFRCEGPTCESLVALVARILEENLPTPAASQETDVPRQTVTVFIEPYERDIRRVHLGDGLMPSYYAEGEERSSAICMALERVARQVARSEIAAGKSGPFVVHVDVVERAAADAAKEAPPAESVEDEVDELDRVLAQGFADATARHIAGVALAVSRKEAPPAETKVCPECLGDGSNNPHGCGTECGECRGFGRVPADAKGSSA